MTYRTLETLRGIVTARLGFGSQGASIGAVATNVNGWLQNAQYQLYWMQDWKKLEQYSDKTLGVNQYLVDYPTNANIDRIKKMAVNIGSGTDQWYPLTEGIETAHYNTQADVNFPQRYERYTQIELWPKCDAVRTLRIWYIASLAAFTTNSDIASMDDEMILLHATATGKAHYRQPDSAMWSSQLEALLAKLRGKTFGNKRFMAPGKEDFDLVPRPRVV